MLINLHLHTKEKRYQNSRIPNLFQKFIHVIKHAKSFTVSYFHLKARNNKMYLYFEVHLIYRFEKQIYQTLLKYLNN